MAKTKISQLKGYIRQRESLVNQLERLVIDRQNFHNDGGIHFYHSQKNSKHNLTRSNMDSQIRNVKRKISNYDSKIKKLQSK